MLSSLEIQIANGFRFRPNPGNPNVETPTKAKPVCTFHGFLECTGSKVMNMVCSSAVSTGLMKSANANGLF